MKKTTLLFVLTACCANLFAQEPDLLQGVEDTIPKKTYVTSAFKSSRVINGHSMEFIGKGVMDFRILHRFGTVDQGIEDFFGLDEATMRMGFDFGLTNNLTIGVGRSTLNKEYDGFIKYRLIHQSTGPKSFPMSVVLVAGTTINTTENNDPNKDVEFKDRVAYYYQAILGRKFSERVSLQLTPTMVHRNLVDVTDDNDIYSLGIGGRLKFSKRMAFVVDYFYVFNGIPGDELYNPLSIGVDIETGGHVFQLHFSNARGMNERAFITETTESWGKGEIRFGFNLSRVFTLGKKKNNW